MANRIQLRRGTSTEWIQFNPVLAEAEFGVEVDTGRFKIGDGATPWQTLKYERPLESVDATPNTLVLRDSNSSLKVKNITLSTGGKLFGTSSSADKLTTARLIGASTTSDLTGSASFDGTSNVDINFQLDEIFTGSTSISYTKFNVDSKGRITSAQNPTTLSGYGILDAQPLNGILSSISSIGTGLGFLAKVETSTSNPSNTVVRSLEVTSGQLTVTNPAATAGNPILGLAATAVTSGSYNTESYVSASGSETVNTTKFTVDAYGRLTSATTIPIATASETQKGLASFNSEDFDVSVAGVVTIANQGVDNDQLQNPKIILGTTDYILGTTYTGFTTISDLTVDTDTLHVDKVNHRLGIGTTTPGNFKVDIVGTGRISGALTSTISGQRPIWSSFGVASTAESGTAPFTVTSTRKVTNLNVDFLDDLTSLDFLRRTDDFNNANNEGNQYIATNFWIDATNVTVQDPIIDIGGGTKGASLSSNDNKDRGLTLQYYSSSASRRAFIGWDNSSGGFALARDVSVSGEIVQGSSTYAALDVGATTLRNGAFTIKTGGTGAGTLGATGETTTFTVAHATGNTSISGTLDVTGNVAINTNKFNIIASSGNTSIAGTLGVTGATTLSSTLSVTDNVTLNKNVTIVGSDTAATEYFKIKNGSAADKFIVDSSSGNTDIKGTLDVLGNIAINTNKFNIIASSGNTSIAGTLGVTGATTLSSTLDVTGNVFVNTNKFMITASSGNTTIAGTLGVGGNTTLTSDLGVTGNTTLTGNLTANANATLGDASADTLTVNATSTFNSGVTLSGSNSLSVGGNITVTGNLIVNGSTTTVNSTTVTVDDPIITLGGDTAPTLDDNKDRGVEFRYYDTQARLGFYGWDDSQTTLAGTTGAYRFLYNATNTSEVFSGTDAGVVAGNLQLTTGTESTSSTTGDLVVSGGVGIGKVLNLTGNFNINTNKFNVVASSGNTSIAGTLGVTGVTTITDSTNATALGTGALVVSNGGASINSQLRVGGNTTLGGSLNVTQISTFNNGVTISGSTTAATEYFRITDGAGTPVTKFLVDSSSGNTTIEGTLGVTGNTTLSGTLGVTLATTLSSTLSVTGDVSVNTNKFNITASSGNTLIAGTLGVSGVTTISNTTDSTALGTGALVVSAGGASINNQLRVGGNTNVGGTLGVTGATTLSSTLSVTNDVTLNRNVTIVGSDTASTEFFKIQNGSSADRFVVDSSSGNTTISGTLGVTSNTTLSGTLGVTNLATFNNGVTISGSTSASTEFFRITDSSSTKFEVDSSTGNTTIVGTLGVTGNFAINTNKFSITASTGDTSIAGNLGVTGNTTITGTLGVTNDFAVATNKFTVVSASGNTSIAGTLGVTNLATFNNGVTIAGSTTAATEYFRITDGAGTPVTKFLVDSSSGNTTISGTLGVTGNTTLSGTLGVTGATTLTGLLNADGGIAVDTNAFTVAGDGTGNTVIGGTLNVTGNTTLTGDLAVNGADITTTTTGTATLFNTNATTLNIGGAATSLSIGASTGTATIRNATVTLDGDLAVNGGDITSSSTTFNLVNGTVTTLNIGGAANTISVGSGSSTATFNNNVTVSGNLTVNGTTTTINSTVINVDDINIELGSVASPTDITANGGGITLKGATDKTLNWLSTGSNWTSSENFDLASGKVYKINNTSVLSSTTLGSGVTSSSLTSVGTLTSLTVSGAATFNGNVTLGDATTDTVTVTSSIASAIIPDGNSTRALGATGTRWSNVWSNQVDGGNLRITGNILSSQNTNGNITLTPNGVGVVETLADVNFGSSLDLSTLTVVGQLNADNIRVDGNTLSSTDTNGNIVITPNGTGKTTTSKDVDVTAILSVVGQLNADNLRLDGNVISSTDTNGSINVTSNGTGTVVLGNVTGGSAITYNSTVAYDSSVTPSNAPIILHKDVAARGKFVIDGDVLVKGNFTQSGGGVTDAGTTATVIEFNGGSAINGREVTLTSTGLGNSYNLDATRASEGGTYNPSYGVKYVVSVQRNSDNKRMMFEMIASWDGVVEYSTSAGAINTVEYAMLNPNNLQYTFDVIWVNTGTYGMRATLRISNVPNGESVTVRMGKIILI